MYSVPRILGPIVSCLENLEKICEKDKGVRKMVDVGFGGVDKLRKVSRAVVLKVYWCYLARLNTVLICVYLAVCIQDILYDFFRSAFDGSGADNFYDAGSCIDGRMTSAWNWCSQLPEKPYYAIFKLTGFTGFDGEFK